MEGSGFLLRFEEMAVGPMAVLLKLASEHTLFTVSVGSLPQELWSKEMIISAKRKGA
jgi:hypothetical protein